MDYLYTLKPRLIEEVFVGGVWHRVARPILAKTLLINDATSAHEIREGDVLIADAVDGAGFIRVAFRWDDIRGVRFTEEPKGS